MVEDGVLINDYVYMWLCEFIIKCGWSNVDYLVLFGVVVVLFDLVGVNMMVIGMYVDVIYS